jgi:hypothetical protein
VSNSAQTATTTTQEFVPIVTQHAPDVEILLSVPLVLRDSYLAESVSLHAHQDTSETPFLVNAVSAQEDAPHASEINPTNADHALTDTT